MDSSSQNNTPLVLGNFTPLRLVALASAPTLSNSRSCNTSKVIEHISIEKYKRSGKGITFADLLEKRLVHGKKQAQDTLKYHLRSGTLFTLEDKRPQQYYPTCIKSEIMKTKLRNYTNERIGVPLPVPSLIFTSLSRAPLSQCLESITLHTLEDYILPLLCEAPLFVHNLRFKTRVPQECYSELSLPCYKKNNGKRHEEIIGNTKVDYILYANGTVDIFTTCSNHPYRIETEEDKFRLIGFFGQLRAGLIYLLNDKHERIVQDISEWELIECDINKDIKVSDLLHLNAIKIRVRHLNHLFSIYIKAKGIDTVCRIEENKHFNKPVIESINDIFNPTEKIERQVSEILHIVKNLADRIPDHDNASRH